VLVEPQVDVEQPALNGVTLKGDDISGIGRSSLERQCVVLGLYRKRKYRDKQIKKQT
jgi:hypothetical protein